MYPTLFCTRHPGRRDRRSNEHQTLDMQSLKQESAQKPLESTAFLDRLNARDRLALEASVEETSA